MTFKEFLNKKHLEYQISQGRSVSAKEFAQWLGASPTSYSNWINSGYKPDLYRVQVLSKKLGMEIYDVLGIPRPPTTIEVEINQLPVGLQLQLRNFVSEVSTSLTGINPESDEAEAIVKSAMEKFGFTFKAKDSSSNPGTEKR